MIKIIRKGETYYPAATGGTRVATAQEDMILTDGPTSVREIENALALLAPTPPPSSPRTKAGNPRKTASKIDRRERVRGQESPRKPLANAKRRPGARPAKSDS